MTELQKIYNTPPWDWPETVTTLFLAALQDSNGDEADRLLAVEMAGNFVVINDDLAEALMNIAEDERESEEIRSKAVISFGAALEYIFCDLDEYTEVDEYNDFAVTAQMYHRIVKFLLKMYFNENVSELIRRRTLEASVRSPQPWHGGAVRAFYQSQKKNLLLTALFCMQYIQGFQQEILEALQSKIPEIQYMAIQAAGNWGVTEAWSGISDVLRNQDADMDLLLAAIDAAVDIGHPEAISVLNDLLDRSRDNDDIYEAVHEALAMLDELF